MEFNHEQNRRYVDQVLTQLTQHNHQGFSVPLPVSYQPGETINFVGFLLLDRSRQSLGVIGIDAMLTAMDGKESSHDYSNMDRFAMGVIGGVIAPSEEARYKVKEWSGGTTYYRAKPTQPVYHNFDDPEQYRWYSYDNHGNEISFYELNYSLYRMMYHAHKCCRFVELIIRAMVEMCGYDKEECVALCQRMVGLTDQIHHHATTTH